VPTRRPALAIAALLVTTLLVSLAPPAAVYAHAGNRLQLYVYDLAVRPAGPGVWMVHAEAIDADSGQPAPGFDVVASGTTPTGRFGPTTLLDPSNAGRYEGVVSGGSGPWTITIRAEPRLGGAPAVPFARTWNVVVAEAGTAPAASVAAGAEPDAPAIDVRLERGSEPGPNEFYVQILVTVLDASTGQPSTHPFDVFATAANRAGETTEAFPLVELPQAGRHSGFVIVPHGGPWTVTAAVNNRRDERNPQPPVTYARTSLDLDVAAGSLTSARSPTRSEPLSGVNVADLTVMWLHVLFGFGWLVTAGLLGAAALPASRRLLSAQARNRLDQRLPAISRGAAWFAGLVILSGVYHLVRSVPYRVPLSVSAAQQVFRLPYAEPYFVALAIKLAAFAATLPVVLTLAVGARRLAVGNDAEAERPAEMPAGRLDPWRTPAPALVGARRFEAAAPSAAPPLAPRPPSVEGRAARTRTARNQSRGPLPVIVLIAAAATITVAVTVLKYLHILSEAARAVLR
jgi:hypothetical protein